VYSPKMTYNVSLFAKLSPPPPKNDYPEYRKSYSDILVSDTPKRERKNSTLSLKLPSKEINVELSRIVSIRVG